MPRSRTHCLDCGVNCGGTTDQYHMLRYKVWAETGADDGMLCLNDIERRIGRPLQYRDFYPCKTPYQRVLWGSARMLPLVWKAHLKARRTA